MRLMQLLIFQSNAPSHSWPKKKVLGPYTAAVSFRIAQWQHFHGYADLSRHILPLQATSPPVHLPLFSCPSNLQLLAFAAVTLTRRPSNVLVTSREFSHPHASFIVIIFYSAQLPRGVTCVPEVVPATRAASVRPWHFHAAGRISSTHSTCAHCGRAKGRPSLLHCLRKAVHEQGSLRRPPFRQVAHAALELAVIA